MLTDTATVKSYFARLGLEPEIAELYLALQAYGPQSISELARNSGIERIRIYRLLDALKASSLVEFEANYKRSIFRAAPIENLHVLITKKEQELESLQDDFDAVAHAIGRYGKGLTTTRMQYYQGMDGLKQMFWNQTRAQSENLSILYENMQNKTNLKYFERWAHTCNERGLKFRSIISDRFVQTQEEWYKAHDNERLKNWESRHVPDDVFLITHSVVLYDDVVTYFNWKDDQLFGLEIHNKEIATAQRQFFEMLWRQALPISDPNTLNTS